MRRSMSMSQCVRAGLTAFGSGRSPSRRRLRNRTGIPRRAELQLQGRMASSLRDHWDSRKKLAAVVRIRRGDLSRSLLLRAVIPLQCAVTHLCHLSRVVTPSRQLHQILGHPSCCTVQRASRGVVPLLVCIDARFTRIGTNRTFSAGQSKHLTRGRPIWCPHLGQIVVRRR